MTVSRRTLIKGSALTLVVSTVGSSVVDLPDVAAVIFDSRLLASQAFAAHYHGRRIDIADEDPKFWQSVRTMAKQGHIVGMTGWADFVIVRGFLQDRGMRITHETFENGCCRWSMR